MPSCYIVDADGNPYLWAQGKNEKLEKRSVTLGVYDEMMDTYEVLSGLTAEDYIAFPDDTLKPGMSCVAYDEGTFIPEDSGDYFDEGFYEEDVMDYYAEDDVMAVDDFAGEVITDVVIPEAATYVG